MNQASRSHDETVVELLREDPDFADAYLAESLDALDEPGMAKRQAKAATSIRPTATAYARKA